LTPYVASALTAKKTLLPTVPLLLRATLLLWERDADHTENTELRVITVLVPSNGGPLWFHSSCFEQICQNMNL
jgi:hypothetical protein